MSFLFNDSMKVFFDKVVSLLVDRGFVFEGAEESRAYDHLFLNPHICYDFSTFRFIVWNDNSINIVLKINGIRQDSWTPHQSDCFNFS